MVLVLFSLCVAFGACFVFCLVRCLIVVFTGSCLTLWSLCWRNWSFFLVCGHIAGSVLNKPFSQILTRILTAVKEDLQKYCYTAYARSCINQMWIMKKSKELLENLKAKSLYSVNSIKSFDFSSLYTIIRMINWNLNKRATGRLPEWHSHCRYADVMQHFFQSCHRN